MKSETGYSRETPHDQSAAECVESAIGHIPIYKRASSEWNATRSNYAKYSDLKRQRMLERIDKAAAFGHTSTISMETWIFLDEKDRLIDFEVDAQ